MFYNHLNIYRTCKIGAKLNSYITLWSQNIVGVNVIDIVYNPGDDEPIAEAVIDIVYDPGYDDEPMAEAVIDIVYNRG